MNPIAIGPLRFRHALHCWRVANDLVVRRASVDSSRPTFLGHIRWMLKWARKSEASWYITHDDEMVGIVRIRDGEISVSLIERGVGIGPVAIWLACWEFARTRDLEVRARIKPDNLMSYSAFRRAGFYQIDEGGSVWLTMLWDQASPCPKR